VELSEVERLRYEVVRRESIERALRVEPADPTSRFHVLAAITRLRRLACHPRLDDPATTARSSKLDAAVELIADLLAEGQRALVFSQFTGNLALLREALDARRWRYLYLDGSTPAPERARLVDAWAAGAPSLFLISLKAGGTGLNLMGADMVLHLDPWWNPAVEDQATDRTHRIGQTKPVTVVRLIAADTIEEAVVALHAEKRELARGLLEGADAAGALSTRELVDLIRAGGA
jgi:SNF2 family DNA or RNA helicase